MPTCLASSSGLLRTIVRPHNSQSRVLVQYAARKVAGCRRTPLIARRATFATAAGVPPKVEEQRAHTLTLLHKTTSLLPRILPNGPTGSDGVPTNESLQFWENVLGRLYEDLSLAPERKEKARVRVAVYGVDEYSPASDLVTALLEDPFVTDEQKKTLRSRWDAQPEGSRVVKLQYGTSPSGEGDVVNVQSSWLQHFGVPLEVSEYRPSSNAEVVEALYSADVPVLLCNPNTTPLPSILPVSLNPPLPITREHTVLAVSAPSPTHRNTAVQASPIKSLAAREDLRVVFVDPARALHGLEQLGHGPASPISVQRYQDDVTGSNVASVTRAVKDILSSAVEEGASLPESSRAVAVHTQTGRALIKDALLTCRTVLRHAELEADAVLTGTSSLRGQMEEAKAKVHMEVFGSPATDGDEIAKAVGQARKSVKVTMDALQWYKLFWRVDDIREVVTAAVDRAWCRDLERKLVFHAGRLAALQASLKDSASALCRSFPPSSPYHSPVLHNSLERLISAPSYPLTASALTAPLHARQSQLGFPTERLHVSAQRAVLTMSGSILGGFGVAWSGWASELGLMGGFINVGMGTETATGVGLLGAVLGVRWAVGRWEKAKKRWWKDWDRVGEGLERDLKATLTQTMDQRVVVVAEKACSGLENIASKRKAEIQQLQDEVRSLESQVDK
ncbi:hypothetical protein PYCCODRAFT_1431273 [Trametes coccinea BRFM310]|uniref:Mmc1 C-terminal domain-containing protein n=1 Tax=Trametes coccinea (strain BRFM310) TaxID=1353009 RepID=A0A1Y2J2G5_TRAC3|nr:hypothetical protein PYCCODRAFT_1431273 [Trametes coccinea BRFM310]